MRMDSSLCGVRRIGLIILLAIAALHPRPLHADFVLVQGGQPRAVVVIPNQPTASVTAAESTLRSVVYLMTGVQLNRLYEKDYKGQQLPAILVGQSSLAQQAGVNIPQEQAGVDRYVIRVTDQRIILVGNDAHVTDQQIVLAGDGNLRGSCFAVNDFLQRLGCRCYGPNALWQIIPSRTTLSASAISVDEWPAFLMRNNLLFTYMGQMGQAMQDAWRMGGWFIDHGHAMERWLPRSVYYTQHPDWFGPGQPCVTHPDVIAFFVDKFRSKLNQQTGLVSFSLSPNDNDDHCECSRCQAVGNVATRWLYFANAIARELAQTHPNRYLLSFYAFRETHKAPKPSFTAEPGVCVVETNYSNHLFPLTDPRNDDWEGTIFDAWKATNPIMAVYDWWIPTASNHPDWKYAPLYSGETTLANLRFWKKQGCRYLFYQTGGENTDGFPNDGFPIRWPLFYVGARGMWDPEITAKEIMSPACTDLYGRAAEPMRQFYQVIEDATAVCTWFVYIWHLPPPEVLYPPDVEWRAIELIEQAEALADDANALRRIQQEGLSIQYLKLARGPEAVGVRYGPLLDKYETIAQREGMIYPSQWRTDWNTYAQRVVVNPMPSDGATNVWPFAKLRWSPPTGGAISYKVYFGTSNPPPLVATTSNIFYDPGILVPETVYYWRTDTISGSITTTGEIRTFTTRQVPTYVDLGSSDEEQGIRRVIASDGNTTPITIGGRDARRNQNQLVDRYMYFDVDDCYAYQGSQPDVYITVSYYDSGSALLSLEYDASSSAYRNGGSVALTNTSTWQQHTFQVAADAYFGNRQSGGADFRISAGANTLFYLDEVVVHRQPGPPTLSVPQIEDGRIGVDENATLSWTPANDATCYRVYFGAANPPPLLATVTGTSFSPGTMDYLRTWYWRIDPVNDYGATTGPVWRFTTRIIEDQDHDGDIDQSDFGYFQACLSGQYIPQNNPACAWAKMDDDSDVDVYDLNLFLALLTGPGVPVVPTTEQTGPVVNAGPNQQIALPASASLNGAVSDDGYPKPPGAVSITWSRQSGPGTVTFDDEHTLDATASFDQPGIYTLRLTGSDSLVTAYDEMTVTVGPAPIPPARAINPVPLNEATGISTSAQLAWSAGGGAVSHNVYFGPTYPPAYRGNQTGTTFNPGTLSPNTTYYWRIDEVNDARATSGSVWTFTTGPS